MANFQHRYFEKTVYADRFLLLIKLSTGGQCLRPDKSYLSEWSFLTQTGVIWKIGVTKSS